MFDQIFSSDCSIEEKSKKFFQKLNSIFQKCFTKIRITGQPNEKDSTVVYMRMKTQLKLDLKNTINKTDRMLIENQLRILENYLSVK